jgi:hypothetical protein
MIPPPPPFSVNYFNAAPWDPMFLELWPSGNSSFELYEDDGITRAALPPTNAFGRTLISVAAPATYLNSSTSGNVTITVGAVQGTFDGQLSSRGWWLDVRCKSSPLDVVLVSGASAPVELPEMQSEAELEYARQGWYFDASQQNGLLMVKLSGMGAGTGFMLTLSNGPSYSHIGTEACDTPTHHQVEEQRFTFNAAGTLTVANSTGCLTIGLDKDPDSHAPALEVQDCASALSDRQQFVLLPSGQLALKADEAQCLDSDVSDSRVIQYACHDPSSPGNQAWTIDARTAHVVNGASGLCMAVFSPA